MKQYAIFSYVKETKLENYDNSATFGVPIVARDLIQELKPVFKTNYSDLGPYTKRADIISALRFAAQNLDPNGFCFFYFHGHGNSIGGRGDDDEPKDQVLVCHDGYLLDDDIDEQLRQFSDTQRIFTIVDSCSSETVIEWLKEDTHSYPKIIHYASARDEGVALALPNGGLLSRRIVNLIWNNGYEGFSYNTFTKRLELMFIASRFMMNKTNNVSYSDMNRKLFK